jgi:hypothetical protein
VQAVVVNLVAVAAPGWATCAPGPVVVPMRHDQEGNDLNVRASVSGVHLVADVRPSTRRSGSS